VRPGVETVDEMDALASLCPSSDGRSDFELTRTVSRNSTIQRDVTEEVVVGVRNIES
jgi:hypothetical protein